MLKSICGILAGLVLALCWTSAFAQDPAALPRQADAFLSHVLDELETVPSVSVAVVLDGEPIYVRAHGAAQLDPLIPADADTAYYVASTTKSFMGFAAAILDERGTINLDDPIADYVPEGTFPDEIDTHAITLRHLLTHTSGLENHPLVYRLAFTGDHDAETRMAILAATTLNDEAPLGTFAYTNVGYNIFAILLESKFGTDWRELLATEVFEPLGMSHTSAYMSQAEREGWVVARPHLNMYPGGPVQIALEKDDSQMQSAGGMIISAADMARWLSLFTGEGSGPFAPGLTEAVTEPLADVDLEFGPYHRIAYGLGWYRADFDGLTLFQHFGGYSGYRAHMSFSPDLGLGVAVLVNEGGAGSFAADTIASYFYDWARGSEDTQSRYMAEISSIRERVDQVRQDNLEGSLARAEREWQLSQPFATYTGIYVNEWMGTMTVEPAQDSLEFRHGRLAAVATPFTEPETARVEFVPGSGHVIQFQDVTTGGAAALNFRGYVFERSVE